MDRREQMRRWLARRAERGLTFRELSQETGVPIGTLGFWSWKFRAESRDVEPQSAFVELLPKAQDADRRFEVVLANGRRVMASEDIDEQHLARVVRALEAC